MKIGLVCPYNIFKGGGVQECVRAMKAELSSRGHQAKIITPMPREIIGSAPQDVIFLGAATDFKSIFGTTSQISASRNDEAVDNLLATNNFDILHFHEPWVPILSRQILVRSSSVNIATFHAKLPDTMMSKTIERVITPYTKSIIKYLSGLTAVSDAAASYVKSLTNMPITIIPNGIDLLTYQHNDKSISPARNNISLKKTKNILFVGRLEKRKGLKYLLKAFALFSANNNGVILNIVGDGPDRNKLEMFAKVLNIKNIKFLGYVGEHEKLRLLNSADLFISPALYGESFGIVLLEAMATGLPLIAGDNPGYASVMTGRGKLSLVNPKNSEEFARRMELFLYDEELRDIWKKWAANHVKQFAYPRVIDAYENLYESLRKRH